MTNPAKRRASYEDVLRAPENMVAEVLDGDLSLHPRPAKPHAAAASALGEELGPPFKRGRGGPGGWIILDEPELHIAEDIVVPDLAGWRRERMPVLTADEPYFTLAPDWACEVLSPTTASHDRSKKLPFYARVGVPHVWLVDPLQRTLEGLSVHEEGGSSRACTRAMRASERSRSMPSSWISAFSGQTLNSARPCALAQPQNPLPHVAPTLQFGMELNEPDGTPWSGRQMTALVDVMP